MKGNSLAQRPTKMLYALLPFFLAVEPSAINETWTCGPEFTFSGHAKTITDLVSDEGRFMGNQMIFNLVCRPGNNDALYCRIEDTKIAKIAPSSYDVSGEAPAEEYKNMGVIKELFEIRFNERGIDGYGFEKRFPPLLSPGLDMIKLIGNQLHVGAKIDDITKPFRTLENFTTGECEVDFIVSRKNDEFRASDDNNREFELSPLESLGELGNSTIEILKKRDVNDCLRCTDYFFETRYIYGIVYRDVFTKLKMSMSRIEISMTSFTSETTNEVELFGNDRKRQGKALDHVMLKLKSVLPAKEELPDWRIMVNNMDAIANRFGIGPL